MIVGHPCSNVCCVRLEFVGEVVYCVKRRGFLELSDIMFINDVRKRSSVQDEENWSQYRALRDTVRE